MKLLLLLLVLPMGLASLEINEVAYFFEEWIEIYNPSNYSVNLSGWQISDNKNTDQIGCCDGNCSLSVLSNDYAILVGRKSSYINNTNLTLFCVDDSKIGNGLGNKGDQLSLFFGNYSFSFNYTKKDGGYKNNKTLERRSDGNWSESLVDGGTPGFQNSNYLVSSEFSWLKINEFLPNPFDKGLKPFGEWVELYNSGDKSLDLRGLKITDSKESNELYIADTNSDVIICAGCYVVVYKNGDSDFSLNNYGYDEVRLWYGEEVLDSVSYSGSTKGMSWSLIGDEWFSTKVTPGEQNKYSGVCDWSLKIASDGLLDQQGFDFSVVVQRNYGFAFNITVKGIIEDYYGKVVKEYSPWKNKLITSSAKKKYSPNLKEGVYQAKFWLENISCDDVLGNNVDQSIFSVNPYYSEGESSLEFEKVNSGKWGDLISVKLKVYKGNSTKKVISVWAEKEGIKVAKRSKLSVGDNYRYYSITLPVQLIANCANEIVEDGIVTLVAEGLDEHIEKEFVVEGINTKVCKDYSKFILRKEKELIKEKKEDALQVDLPASLDSGSVVRFSLQLFDDAGFEAWSYLYRGSKCYSCADSDRESNKISFKVDGLQKVELINKIDDGLEDGVYKMMVKLKKEGRKTAKRIIKEVYIKSVKVNIVNASLPVLALKTSQKVEVEKEVIAERMVSPNSRFSVYQSTSMRPQKLIPLFLAITFGLLLLHNLFR